MENQQNGEVRRPRRRPRTKMEIFKQDRLPLLIVAAAVVLIVIFIIGAIYMSNQRSKANQRLETQKQQEYAALSARADALIAKADELAAAYDYQAAVDKVMSFGDRAEEFPQLEAAIQRYRQLEKQLVVWDDPSQILNLSFQMLVADTSRAFTYPSYGNSINRNFVTTTEFARILQQLYDNGYVLVDRDAFLQMRTDEFGEITYETKAFRLPEGKKPVMLTQTNVNYNLYLVDSDGDMVADKNGAGFASRMMLSEGGDFYCEMVDGEGQLVTGDFDLVPILEKFIEAHPDFSYRGARATLALTGYNGLFGHRTHAAAKSAGDAAFQQAREYAVQLVDALTDRGYTLACYTYENIGYGSCGFAEVRLDMKKWQEEVEPILGKVDTLVFAQNSDLTEFGPYSGDKYELLQDSGFGYFVGFCNDGTPQAGTFGEYFRQERILVTGNNLKYRAQWFTELFDAETVLDASRPEIS